MKWGGKCGKTRATRVVIGNGLPMSWAPNIPKIARRPLYLEGPTLGLHLPHHPPYVAQGVKSRPSRPARARETPRMADLDPTYLRNTVVSTSLICGSHLNEVHVWVMVAWCCYPVHGDLDRGGTSPANRPLSIVLAALPIPASCGARWGTTVLGRFRIASASICFSLQAYKR